MIVQRWCPRKEDRIQHWHQGEGRLRRTLAPRRRRKEENVEAGGGGKQRRTFALRRTRMEEDAGVEEYNAGRTTLVVRCWRLWRATEKKTGV